MSKTLDGRRIAFLASDGFEQSELFKPLRVLKKEGAEVEIISIKKGIIRAWDKTDWGKEIEATASTDSADPADYDALFLPGGVMSPDRLRANASAVNFVRSFVEQEKPIAAICHGPWTLIEAGGVKNKKLTSWPSLRTDLENAGAIWIDCEVVVDQGLITSRKPDDLTAFNEKMIEQFTKLIPEEEFELLNLPIESLQEGKTSTSQT